MLYTVKCASIKIPGRAIADDRLKMLEKISMPSVDIRREGRQKERE